MFQFWAKITRNTGYFFDHHGLVRLKLGNEIKRFLSQAQLDKSKAVLDFGCGTQPYRGLINTYTDKYIPVDLLPLEDSSNVVGVEIDGQVPVDESSIDMIISIQVLEHVWNTKHYLGEVRRMLRPDGRLILSTHGVWLFHPHPNDYRRWTIQGLEKELEESGFEIESISPILGPLAWSSQMRLLGIHALFSRIPFISKLCKFLVYPFLSLLILIEDLVTPFSIRKAHACIYCVMAKIA